MDIFGKQNTSNIDITMTHAITHLIDKLWLILHTGWGWLLVGFIFLADYFAGHTFIVSLVVAVTLMDAGWGIAVSLKQGKFTKSELARLTIDKLAVYGCAMFVFVGLDKLGDTTITASVVGAAIVLVEWWSSMASMLILFPHIVFLRLMKRVLIGEIASKLRIEEAEVEKYLKKLHAKPAKPKVTKEQVHEARRRAKLDK